MNLYSSALELREALILSGTARFDGGVVVTNPARFRAEMLDSLVWTAVFGKGDAREAGRHAIREAAESLGILPASILPLYRARGRGEVSGFTVPAINIRIMSYDTARAAMRAARKLDVGAVIFEIARSEMGYTEQRPAEYAAVMLAAAIREEWQGPFFLQGDHFQTNPKKMKEAPDKEIAAIEALIEESIPAGFLQIDIDTSTLVDLSKPTLEAQQDVNATLCARFTKFIRVKQPKAMPISVGGEIGEVGKENSTPEEFRAYMNVYKRALGSGAGIDGIEKVSVQTGSSHGGRRRGGRLGRARRDRLQRHQDDLQGRARRVRPRRRGPARRVDAAARILRALSRPRLRRDPSRDRLHEHGLRPPRVPVADEARDRALARQERRRGAQEGRDASRSSSTRRARRPSARTRKTSGTCPRARRRPSARRSRRSSRSSSRSSAS